MLRHSWKLWSKTCTSVYSPCPHFSSKHFAELYRHATLSVSTALAVIRFSSFQRDWTQSGTRYLNLLKGYTAGKYRIPGSSVSIVTKLRAGRLRQRGPIPGRCQCFKSSLHWSDRFWGSHSILIRQNREVPTRGTASRVRSWIFAQTLAEYKMSGAAPPLLHKLLLHKQGQL